MSILDSESFESYFTTSDDTQSPSSPCTTAKGRYHTCFFKSYSEKYQRGESLEKCESLFNEYKSCLSKTLKSPPSPPPSSPQVIRVRETDPWKRMTSSK